MSQVERSMVSSEVQPENIELMLVTFDVSQAERSMVASEVQPENIELMFVTFDVHHPDRSRDVRQSQ